MHLFHFRLHKYDIGVNIDSSPKINYYNDRWNPNIFCVLVPPLKQSNYKRIKLPFLHIAITDRNYNAENSFQFGWNTPEVQS